MPKLSFKKMQEFARKPKLFEQSTAAFWDDEHISKSMLEAHLSPDCDAASRKPDFIKESVDWILSISKLKKGQSILDLGCGPGLYAEKFSERGYKVTGVDFSKRSINYAKERAVENNLNISYFYQNYLEIDFKEEFDLVILIYCDFGVLSIEQANIVLEKAFNSLKPGGKLIFDVFTHKQYDHVTEGNVSWEFNETESFWSDKPHICLNSHYIYEENDVHLNQTILCDKDENIEVFRIWDHFYSPDTIKNLLEKFSYKNIQIFSDVKGTAYSDESKVLGVVAEK